VLAFAVAPASLGQPARERPINFIMMTTEPYDKLARAVQPVIRDLQQWPGMVGVDSDLRLNKPELRLNIDRDRAADAGVQVESIGRAIETMLGGRQVTRFKRNGEQYDVIVQLDPAARNSPQDIASIFVRGRGDAMIPLSSLVAWKEAVNHSYIIL
jgi:multidrug efflux pump